MNIRFATQEDTPSILMMYRELFKEMSLLQPNYLREANQDPKFIKETIKSKKSKLFIAENAEKEICGFGLVLYQTTPPYSCLIPKKLLYLCDLYVCKKARKQGIAHSMISAIQAYAELLKVDYIELAVLPENKKAIQLYEKLDYRTTLHTMKLEIQKTAM